MDKIVNKVAKSGIVTIDLADLAAQEEIMVFDIRPHLFMEQVLREKDFRQFVKTHDWSVYAGKAAGITCSADAIVPTWAYMLVALAMGPHAEKVYFGNAAEVLQYLFAERISAIDPEAFRDARVVIKGCGDLPVPANAYVMIAARLRPFVKSIMYGEPCSTVPLYKAARPGA